MAKPALVTMLAESLKERGSRYRRRLRISPFSDDTPKSRKHAVAKVPARAQGRRPTETPYLEVTCDRERR